MVKHAPTREEWDEKLCDAINYLLLLSAMVDEELANETEPREGLASNNARSIYKANKEDERMITNAQD
jgi:hypothetical protein